MPNGNQRLARYAECTGCGACANACPCSALSMVPDDEGFLRPDIGASCIGCGACQDACPILSPPPSHSGPERVHAAWCIQENERRGSTSGGFFRVLVRYVLERGGVVFGAAFDENLMLRHRSAQTPEECEGFYGSKYLQSDTAFTYREVREALDAERWVLFSGTPCQVAGLYACLGGDHERLITCDIVCAGVPSPAVFRAYIEHLQQTHGSVAADVRFRDKRHGWKQPHFAVTFQDGRQFSQPLYETAFGRGFGMALTLRHSCGTCPYARAERMADFTLGDFWGLKEGKQYPVDTGVSLVIRNSKKAAELELPPLFEQVERPFGEAVAGNPRLARPVTLHQNRAAFFKDFTSLPFDRVMKTHLTAHPLRRFLSRIKRHLLRR